MHLSVPRLELHKVYNVLVCKHCSGRFKENSSNEIRLLKSWLGIQNKFLCVGGPCHCSFKVHAVECTWALNFTTQVDHIIWNTTKSIIYWYCMPLSPATSPSAIQPYTSPIPPPASLHLLLHHTPSTAPSPLLPLPSPHTSIDMKLERLQASLRLLRATWPQLYAPHNDTPPHPATTGEDRRWTPGREEWGGGRRGGERG